MDEWLERWNYNLEAPIPVQPWSAAGFVLGRRPEFKSSATLVNSQLVRFKPVGMFI